MVYRGHVKKGVVVLENGGAGLRDGTEVTVRPVALARTKRPPTKRKPPTKPTKQKPSGPAGVSPGLLRLAGARRTCLPMPR